MIAEGGRYTPPRLSLSARFDICRSEVSLTSAGQLVAQPLASARESVRVGRISLATVALALLVAWLPIQTPLAIVVFQYWHQERVAYAMLLAKDVFAAVLILYLFARHWRRIRFYWFDWAAAGYCVLLVVYAVVPWLLGSMIGVLPVFASLRELAVPVELYALGRLAIAAGANFRGLVLWSLLVALISAAFTVFVYFMLPIEFYSTTLDLVTFVRVVQGLPNAHTLWDISLIARFGEGAWAAFPRAVGPFTQPVGTANYFVLPLLMAVAWFYDVIARRSWVAATGIGVMAVLLAAAVITPISRAAWIAVALAVLVLSVLYNRRVIVGIALVAGVAVLLAIPSARYSIIATVTGTDASASDHAEALDTAVRTVISAPLGLGVGQSGQFGQVLATGDQAGSGVGENMFLELLVSVGPLGFLAFVAWLVGLFKVLTKSWRRPPPHNWIVLGIGTALLGYVVSSMFSSALMRFTTSATVWLIVGLAVGVALAARASASASVSGAVPEPAAELASTAGAPGKADNPA